MDVFSQSGADETETGGPEIKKGKPAVTKTKGVPEARDQNRRVLRRELAGGAKGSRPRRGDGGPGRDHLPCVEGAFEDGEETPFEVLRHLRGISHHAGGGAPFTRTSGN